MEFTQGDPSWMAVDDGGEYTEPVSPTEVTIEGVVVREPMPFAATDGGNTVSVPEDFAPDPRLDMC